MNRKIDNHLFRVNNVYANEYLSFKFIDDMNFSGNLLKLNLIVNAFRDVKGKQGVIIKDILF
jgi:hypothetical protein